MLLNLRLAMLLSRVIGAVLLFFGIENGGLSLMLGFLILLFSLCVTLAGQNRATHRPRHYVEVDEHHGGSGRGSTTQPLGVTRALPGTTQPLPGTTQPLHGTQILPGTTHPLPGTTQPLPKE